MTAFRLASGGSITTGTLIRTGGEGAVYEVQGRADLVAKVYLKPQTPDRVAKLQAMAARATPDLAAVCAWPIDILQNPKGVVTGFLMPRIANRQEIHVVCTNTSRKREYPSATWPFLIHLAENVAAAVDTIHTQGLVIGDVNEGGFLVGHDATVRVIDTDSFQFTHQGRLYRCEVGIPEFTPPELHGLSGGFAGVVRTVNHDLFGLATIIFRLIMAGRWPFSGRPLDHADPDPATMIAQYRYAYATDAARRRIAQPPHCLPLSVLGPEISGFFEQAFTESGRVTRPTAARWVEVLRRFKNTLKPCAVLTMHHHPVNQACPWCGLEQASGVVFFLGVLTGDPQAGWVLRLGEFEEIVKRYPTLGSNPFPSIAIAPPPPHPIPPAALAARAALRWIRPFLVSSAVVFTIVLLACLPSAGATWIAGVVVLAACVWPVKATVFEAERKRRIWHLATIRERVSFLYKQWDSDHREQYNREVIELGRSLDKYRDLDRRRGTILTDLERERRDQQFHDYLDGFPIGPAKIKNIGTGRKQVLETYGIETAADVNRARLANVPGFGPGLTKDLMDWRKSLSATFRYDGSKPVERSVAMRALQPLQQERQMLEAAILRSQAVLGNLHQQMTERRSTVRREVEEALRTMAQAQADVDIMAKAG